MRAYIFGASIGAILSGVVGFSTAEYLNGFQGGALYLALGLASAAYQARLLREHGLL